MIVVIDGLSLTGKTTLCKQLLQHYSGQGLNCKLCLHGHLCNDEVAEQFYQKTIKAYNEWSVQEAIYWSIASIQQDFSVFEKSQDYFSQIDLVFLDRHYLSQYVVAEYFSFPQIPVFHKPSCYHEFLVTTSFPERIKRASIRKDNHSKLTDYTLSSMDIHLRFEALYRKYLIQNGTPEEHILSNNDFKAKDVLIRMIDKLL